MKKIRKKAKKKKFAVAGNVVYFKVGKHWEVYTICRDSEVAEKFMHP